MSYKDHQLGHNRSASVNQSAENSNSSYQYIFMTRKSSGKISQEKKRKKNVYTFFCKSTREGR